MDMRTRVEKETEIHTLNDAEGKWSEPNNVMDNYYQVTCRNAFQMTTTAVVRQQLTSVRKIVQSTIDALTFW